MIVYGCQEKGILEGGRAVTVATWEAAYKRAGLLPSNRHEERVIRAMRTMDEVGLRTAANIAKVAAMDEDGLERLAIQTGTPIETVRRVREAARWYNFHCPGEDA